MLGSRGFSLPLLVSHPARLVECFLTTPGFYSTSQSFGFVSRVLSLRNSFLNESSHRMWKDAKLSVNWIGVTEILLLLLSPVPFSASPLGIPDGFGEDVVSPIQIHDPILQVEFPFVLTSVNLQSKEKEMSVVGVKDRWTLFQLTVDAD